MSKVIVEFSMSLDEFIAGPDDNVDQIFQWYFSGDTEVAMPNYDLVFKTDPVSAEVIRESFHTYGANVTGQRTFDVANAWGGKAPLRPTQLHRITYRPGGMGGHKLPLYLRDRWYSKSYRPGESHVSRHQVR